MKPRQLYLLREYLLPALVCTGLALALSFTPSFQRSEFRVLDQFTQVREHFQPPPDPRVVTVAIDDPGIIDFGQWPWRREIHGKFMQALANIKPAVVTWDILFTEPSPDPAQDQALSAGATALDGHAVFASFATVDDPRQPAPATELTAPLTRIEGDLKRIPTSPFAAWPITAVREAGYAGFADTPAGSDSVRRHAPLIQRVGTQVFPSLALQTLLVNWQLKPEQVRVVLGDAIYLDGDDVHRRIPIDETGGYLINYRFGLEHGNLVSYLTLYQRYTQHFLEGNTEVGFPSMYDKILVVGQFGTGLTDFGASPFEAQTPLVLVHSNIIENILREDYAHRAPNWPALLGVLILGVTGLVYFPKRALTQQTLFAVGVPVVYLGGALLLWIRWSLWLPLIWPVLGFAGLQLFMIVRQLVREQRAKEKIRGMFGSYISPELVSRMVESGQSPQLGGHEEIITAYFSDIQNFSTFSEQLPPDRLVELMNEYLTLCTDIVQEEGGTLDKYIGDAVVVMFGAPMPLPDHALRACVASQRIQQKLTGLREKWRSEGDRWPAVIRDIQSRIGLNSGAVIVGNMGSRTRFNYTMMGDNVNLAARMESGAKTWGVYSMCTEATQTACVRDGGDRVVFRPLGRVVVKGRAAAVPIFEIVGLKETVTETARECLRLFEQGLARYYARDWDAALAFFNQSERLEPNQPGQTPGVLTNPSRVYLALVQRYQLAPPPPEWEGEYVMTVK